MNYFCKNPIKRITNEHIRAKIKKNINQVDIDDNMIIVNMTNNNYFNAINIGTIYIT